MAVVVCTSFFFYYVLPMCMCTCAYKHYYNERIDVYISSMVVRVCLTHPLAHTVCKGVSHRKERKGQLYLLFLPLMVEQNMKLEEQSMKFFYMYRVCVHVFIY